MSTPTLNQSEETFQAWWFNEGSGMPPLPSEDTEAHVHRIARLAWLNGAFQPRRDADEYKLELSRSLDREASLRSALALAKQYIAGEFGFENWRIEKIEELAEAPQAPPATNP